MYRKIVLSLITTSSCKWQKLICGVVFIVQAEEQSGKINRKRIKLSRKLYIQDKNSSPSVVASDGYVHHALQFAIICLCRYFQTLQVILLRVHVYSETSVKIEHRQQTQQLYIASLHNLGRQCELSLLINTVQNTRICKDFHVKIILSFVQVTRVI